MLARIPFAEAAPNRTVVIVLDDGVAAALRKCTVRTLEKWVASVSFSTKTADPGFLWIFLLEIFACNHILALQRGPMDRCFTQQTGSNVGDHIVKYAARLGGLGIPGSPDTKITRRVPLRACSNQSLSCANSVARPTILRPADCICASRARTRPASLNRESSVRIGFASAVVVGLAPHACGIAARRRPTRRRTRAARTGSNSGIDTNNR